MHKTIAVLAFLSVGLMACGDPEFDDAFETSEFETSEFETSESALARSTQRSTFVTRSTKGRTGSLNLTADPDAVGVYTCCDSDNNCYDIERDEDCGPSETLLWCMGDGRCEPGTNTD